MAAEVGLATFSGILSKVVELLIDPIRQEVSHVYKCKRNVEELKKKVEDLTDHARDRVEGPIENAKSRGEEIFKDVEKWLAGVNDFTENVVQPIIDDEDKAMKKCCFKGLCPNLITRYYLGKKAANAVKDSVALLEKGRFDNVSYRRALKRSKSVYIKGYEDFNSRLLVLDDIMETMANDNVNLLIGVYGMGGVGKTTLVKRVAWQALEDNLFDEVVMVEQITENPDLERIQGQIANELGLEFREESLSGRATRLRDRLKKDSRRILVILDNIWEKLDLEAIGIPFGDDNDEKGNFMQQVADKRRRCKILLTSRNLDVLRNEMNTRKNFLVQILSDEEAGNLFWKTVGYSEEKSDLEPTAIEIIKRCAGLPVAIATIASALKHKSDSVWKNALNQLRRSNPRKIKGMDSKVFNAIELSYNYLESEEQSLFLLCGLYNAGARISSDYLLRCGMGLGLFKDVYSLQDGRLTLQTLIDNLKASCLLIDDGNDFVKMHDIIHSVAVSIASTDKLMFNIQCVAGLKEMLEKKLLNDSAAAVSLPYGDIDELPERLECPKLEFLLLSMNILSLQIPDSFFEGMKELKVINLGKIHLLSLPSSLRWLTGLQTLCLDDCLLGDVAIIGELKKLEILSFSRSDIEKLPENFSHLTRLKLLDLRNCFNLKVIAPNIISSMIQLEELYIGNSFVEWDVEEQSNASLAELKRLSHLTTLEIGVLDARIIPQDLVFERMERYRIFIGDGWNWSGKYESLRTLKLKLSNSIYLGNGVATLLNRAEDLYLNELKGVKNVVFDLNAEGFRQLKHLHVQNGAAIQYIISTVGLGPCDVFSKLNSLSLHNLINLEKICHGQLAAETFSKLRLIEVEKCERLKHLFSLSMATNLLQLQEMKVTDCKKLEEIVYKESQDHVPENERISKIKFNQLRNLTLRCLPRLTSFGFNVSMSNTDIQEIVGEDDEPDTLMPFFSQNVVLPSLEDLKLSIINFECRWLDQLPVISSCCKTLTSLAIEECCGLKFLFSYSIVKSLVRLQELKIWNCKSIEGIINTEETDLVEVIEMIFPKLHKLHLKGLPKLTRFGSENSVELPVLVSLLIEDCPNLKAFFPGSMCSSDIIVSKESGEMKCLLDIHPLFDKKVVLLSLKELKLYSVSTEVAVWCNQLPQMSSWFQNITKLFVDGCDNLKFLFSSSMVKFFVQLKLLQISNCELMEAVIVEEESSNGMMLFPKLDDLTLLDLPKLTKFCQYFTENLNGLSSLSQLSSISADTPASNEENLHTDIQPLFDEKVGLPGLKVLKISNLESLEKIWNDDRLNSNSFYKLEDFQVCNCNKLLNVFPSNMLGRLERLDFLLVRNCSSLEEIFELEALKDTKTNAINNNIATQLKDLDLTDLPKLKHVWNIDSSSSLLGFRNLVRILIRNCDSLRSLFPASIAKDLRQLEKLEISYCCMVEEIVAKGEEVEEPTFVFPQLKKLTLGVLSRLKSFYPGLYISKWPILKYLIVYNCEKVDIISSSLLTSFQETYTESQREISIRQPLFLVDQVAFPSLEVMWLDWNVMVKDILHGNFSEYSCKLKELQLDSLRKEDAILSNCFLNTLPNLEKLEATGCFKEIFLCKEFACMGKHAEPDVAALSKLRNLKLLMPQLLHLWKENSQPSKLLENLATLEVSKCGMLKKLAPSSVSFLNLTTLEVSNCNGLLALVAPSTAKSLVQLTKMNISDCKMIKDIIAQAEYDELVEDGIIFKKLKFLTLHCLPSLTSFYSGNCTIEFPSLQQVVVRQCPNMKIFSHGVLSIKKLHSLQMAEAEDEWCWDGSLNTTIQKLFKEMVGFRGLQLLTLSEFPHLKEVWHDHRQLPASFFCNLKSMVVDECDENMISSSAISDNMLLCLDYLEKLEVRNCDSQHVFDLEELNADEHFEVLSQLIQFYLTDLPRLNHIWKKIHPPVFGFRKLKWMNIHKCNSLRYVFTPSIAFSLEQLQKLEIKKCAIMEEIITMEVDQEDAAAIDKKITFPQLNSIVLESLPNFTSFYPGSNNNTMFLELNKVRLKDLPKLTTFCNFSTEDLIELSSLSELWMENCPNMKTFISNSTSRDMPGSEKSEETNFEENLLMQPLFGDKVVLSGLKELGILQMDNLRKIWHDQLSLDVCKLEKLRIQSCNKLLNVFQSNMFRRLQRLEILEVLQCDSLEEIFECQALSGGKTVHVTAASQLKKLHLSCLPKLKHVWNMDCQGILGFRNLLSTTVDQCNSLKNIFPASIAAGLHQLEELQILSCMVEEIVANDEEEEEVEVVTRFVFPQLTSLQLLQLSKLKSFCSGLYISEWPVLKKLIVWRCHKVEAIVSEFSSVQETQHGESQHDNISIIRQPLFLVDKVAFPSLEELSMEWNRFVKEIFHGNFSSEYSCKLKVIVSLDFPNRSGICLSCFLCKFPNLERLEVYHGLLKEMFRGDHQGLCSMEKRADEVPFKLCHLKLFNLSDSYLSEENSQFSKAFHDLAILEVLRCDVLENLVPSSTTFRNLTTLEVSNCGRLLSLVTHSTAQSLVQLKRMNISDCKTMKEIITVVGDEVKDHRIIFNRLEYIGLHRLPSLISFLSGNCVIDIEFPSLQQVNITLCPKMKTFSQGALSTPKLYTIQTKEMMDEGRWEGDLNGTIEQLFIQMNPQSL